MKYRSDIGLKGLLDSHRKRLISNVYYGIFIVFISLIIMYYLGGQKLDFKNVLCILIFIVTIGFIQYYQVVPNGIVINQTVEIITIEMNHLIVETAPFKVLFWINRPVKTITFSEKDLKIRKVSYPVKSIYDIASRVLKLTDDKNEVFIIADYFDEELEGKLTNFR